jgi:hypothetical protein
LIRHFSSYAPLCLAYSPLECQAVRARSLLPLVFEPRTLRCDTNYPSSAFINFGILVFLYILLSHYTSASSSRSAFRFSFAIRPSSYSTLEVNSIMAHRLINKRVSSVEHYPGHTSLRGLYRRLPLPHLIIVLRSTLAATCFIIAYLNSYSCIHTSHSDTSTVPHPNPPFSRHAFPSLGSPSRRNFLNRQVSIIS